MDDAELTYEHPVVSLSLGRSCVFLIGGRTKGLDEAPPLALVLRSGYALLMHGDSRLRMHGVAKVFPCPCGDARRVPRVAGAAKKKLKWSSPVCECVCSSFDQELKPQARLESPSRGPSAGDTSSRRDGTSDDNNDEEDHNDVLCCHDNLGGVDCANHRLFTTGAEGAAGMTNEDAKMCASCAQPLLSALEVQRVLKYLQTARVNINVRQVYPIGLRPA